MLDATFIEMERGAKALDLHDINTAAVCLRKAMEGHVEMAPAGPTPPPQDVSPMAEIAKSINALETKDFGVSALCCEKAATALEGRLPTEVVGALHNVGRAVRTHDWGTAANHLRDIVRHYHPEMTLPAPAEAPNLVSASAEAPNVAAAAAPDPLVRAEEASGPAAQETRVWGEI